MTKNSAQNSLATREFMKMFKGRCEFNPGWIQGLSWCHKNTWILLLCLHGSIPHSQAHPFSGGLRYTVPAPLPRPKAKWKRGLCFPGSSVQHLRTKTPCLWLIWHIVSHISHLQLWADHWPLAAEAEISSLTAGAGGAISLRPIDPVPSRDANKSSAPVHFCCLSISFTCVLSSLSDKLHPHQVPSWSPETRGRMRLLKGPHLQEWLREKCQWTNKWKNEWAVHTFPPARSVFTSGHRWTMYQTTPDLWCVSEPDGLNCFYCPELRSWWQVLHFCII